MRRTLWIALGLALCLPIGACGSGGASPTAGFSLDATEYALPFLPGAGSIEAPVYGFKNLADVPVTITATAYLPGGGMYPAGPVPVAIPAYGETRVALGTLLGGISAGGWVGVDTSGPAAGLIVPYVDRFVPGGKRSAEKGLAFRPGTVSVTLAPFATAYQVVNHSKTAGGVPTAATFDLTTYDEFGAVATSSPGVAFAPEESKLFAVTPGTVGLVVVTPVAPLPGDPHVAVAAQENGVPVHTEYRYRHGMETRLTAVGYAFELEFGRDGPGVGNVHDFAVLLSNPGTSLETLTINAIYRANGTTILGTPRFVTIDAKATKFLATRTIDSFGLDVGSSEVTPFEDLFGDVSAAGSVTSFTLLVTAPAGVDVSARHYDRLFRTYCRLVPPRRLTANVNVSNLPIQTTAAGATRTYVDLFNPTAFEQTVFVRGFTPGGTEYLIDPVTVGPFRRVRWSQDGVIFREVPGDTSLPPVPFMSFELTSTGGMHFGARTEVEDVQGIFTNLVPIIVRNLAFE